MVLEDPLENVMDGGLAGWGAWPQEFVDFHRNHLSGSGHHHRVIASRLVVVQVAEHIGLPAPVAA